MKKKILGVILALLLIVPVLTLSAKEKEKVKVYVFEAGGCPYCEAQIEYLEGLDSYNKKFTIERRELYVDHVDWEQGRDYKLGKAVAEQFQKDGFKDASYQGTPFVVISDLYAAATYSTDLESYINKAYKNGDKDVVNKIAKKLKVSNKTVEKEDTDDVEVIATTGDETSNSEETKSPSVIVIVAGLIVVVGAMVFIIKRGSVGDSDDEEYFEEEDNNEEDNEKLKENKKPERKTTKKTVKKTNKR